ncbi:MAG: DEAD/DEAH box helicase family protein [Chitinophagaceae bacterium]|nr:DEAD/DEAH box helicase family protein [Chitinophagaceae bacterium]MCW5903975.1 DEAD/DEAH box helicase family protein [Chitinophagaceae bacterium]
MALPYLIKCIYNNGSEEAIRRGKKIHTSGKVELIENNSFLNNIVFRVKDDTYATYYKVYINNFQDEKKINFKCTCPYNISEICRHKAGALFHLQELVERNMLGNTNTNYNQQHTVIRMKQLDLKLIKMLSSPKAYADAEEFLRTNKANIIDTKDESVLAEVNWHGAIWKVIIRKNEERFFDTSCNDTTETSYPLCTQKVIVFLQLLNNYGANYFDTIRNWDVVKNKLLGIYGYSLDDDLTGKFEFTYQNGKPFLRVIDTSIKRINTPINTEPKPKPAWSEPFEQTNNLPTEVVSENTNNIFQKSTVKLGVVISPQQQYPYVQVEAIQGEPDDDFSKYISKIEKLDLNKFINTEPLSEDDKILLQQLRKFLPSEINKYLTRNSPFSGVWDNIIQQHNTELPEETKHIINEYLHSKIKNLFTELAGSNFTFYLPEGKKFITANLENAEFSHQTISPQFSISYQHNVFDIICQAKLPHTEVNLLENKSNTPLIFNYHHQLYTWKRIEDIQVIDKFLPEGKITVAPNEWEKYLHQLVLPLSKEYSVDFGNLEKTEVKDEKPDVKLLLQERGEYLIFQPVFSYKGYDVRADDKETIILPLNGTLLLVYRNTEAEKEWLQKIENLHSHFIKPIDSYTLALRGVDVLKNNWFFLFVDAMKEMNIAVYGMDALKNFRFNTAKPSTKIHISSNTDWFDAKIEIQFGEQKITIDDVKKALANKQQFVPLADGTLGILPEEWIRKYSLLFKVGDGKINNMKLSKYQFSVVEDLYNQRNEEELFVQLEEKYDRLRYNHEIKKINPPEHLTHILRPYQESGFQWLNYLKEVSWGGILADDMGLGKTVQALSFLHHLKEEGNQLKALVVCPTTLMFNWQNEIKKFTPLLNSYTHHGSARNRDAITNTNIDIVITTYGTLRSDIKYFAEINFDYIILDESQAIKNPSSKVTKAACILKAKNRLCLSGTPLQNNTFDIFAQMNFLNPGMLGSQEFFKNEFAVPIDKFGEKEQKEHLRKLLYPFILRRTKEQVAKDLPEKQEMILYCEMNDEQRKIYDTYRNDFRDKILGAVQEKGIQKSQLTILQGLMKLRQICDSTAILKEQDGTNFPNHSVKLEEIGREITENISNHKALIFSQFLGMLALIKEKMKELEIDFEYFDGSTSATDREKAINRFQNDENCRVFLISLKAGGIGLNLTAADYVYIVDPWWNPAVEQQAIDRTHRIGQTKNIFAYRMICTDTVEDKILKLQEKKKALAKDLITDDEGFVKSLTKEDVEYLFS